MIGGSWQLATALSLTGSQQFLGSAITIPIATSQSASQSLPFGTAEGTMNILVIARRGLLPGATETLDLYDGSLLDLYDDAAEFKNLRGYAFWIAAGGDASGVTIGGAASNPHPLFFADTSDKKTVYPSGPADSGGSPAGIAVTSTSRNVLIANNGAVHVSYILLLAGTISIPGALMGILGLTYP